MSKANDDEEVLKERRREDRPSVLEKDPHLAEEVAALRTTGRSWTEVSTHLRIGRTTARSLVKVCQKEIGSQIKDEMISAVPKTSSERGSRDKCQSFEF